MARKKGMSKVELQELMRRTSEQMAKSVLCPATSKVLFTRATEEQNVVFEYELDGQIGTFNLNMVRSFPNGWKQWKVTGTWPERLKPFCLLLVAFELPENVTSLYGADLIDVLGHSDRHFNSIPLMVRDGELLAYFLHDFDIEAASSEACHWVIRAERLPE